MNHLVLLDNKEFLNRSCKNIYLGPWKKCDFLKDNFSKYAEKYLIGIGIIYVNWF